MGMIPLNDSINWIERAQAILENNKISIRPMFSLFLSYFIFLFGVNMPAIIAVMFIVNIIAIVTAFIILKDIQKPVFVTFFLSFICAWRIFFLSLILTENLAASLLIIAFALLFKALYSKNFNTLFIGYFFIGLAQAIRPWDFFIILLLPLLGLSFKTSFKKRIVFCLLLLTAAFSSYIFGNITSDLFSTSVQSKLDIARHLHGQTSGTQAAADLWIIDPKLKSDYINMVLGKIEPDQVAQNLYSKAFSFVKTNPKGWIHNIFFDLKYYLSNFNSPFSQKLFSPFIFVFFIVFFLFFYYFFLKVIPFKRKDLIIAILLLGSCLLNKGIFGITIILAVIYMLKNKMRSVLLFSLLYFLSIYFSMCVVGIVGIGRMWVSHEMFAFALCSIAFSCIMSENIEINEDNSVFILQPKKIFKTFSFCLSASFLFFVIFPLITRALHENPVSFSSNITEQEIKEQLNIKQPIVSPEKIKANIFLWPVPSFEKLNRQLAYIETIYRPYKAVFYGPDEGVSPSQYSSQWYMLKMPFKRVCYDQRYPIVFPQVTQDDLFFVNNKEIIVLGTLMGRPRQKYTEQGFFILANMIGYPDLDGNIKWVSLKTLAEKNSDI
ncbi:MAG: hypothetical protein PHQ52_05245 [Candidatus Omnitrophica bacterium]|nr:hypothetical protein [Candidatus Omnitrophota bacterium]